ncbi:hypothetical protein HYN59_12505 [Flavobacterium album]|uniref:Uncharacterized protein n=2 Tax=Flavobacterium album TaxID=2175091 RepID=A0A2S1QZU2_9FLAO|nr:hypothetical protein HYN59_12505 [Flavobacterium album]
MSADNIWMQGNIEIRINGEKPCSDGDIINIGEFLKSLEADGEYFIFSCCCGLPACSGWIQGIQVSHSGEYIEWADLNNTRKWSFNKQKVKDDLGDIRKEVAIYKSFFSRKGIEYVGAGYDW